LRDQSLKAVKLGYLLGRKAETGRRREGFGDGLTYDLAQQTELWVTSAIGPSAMTLGLATPSWNGGYVPGAKIAEGEELPQQLGTSEFEIGKRIGHGIVTSN
jgi:hypothetical protein